MDSSPTENQVIAPVRILLVDDDHAQRDLLQRALSAPGYRVLCAEGPTEALAYLAVAPFDLVCIDLDLASGDDWTLLAAIRDHSPGLPIGIITEWSVAGLAAELAPLGVVFALTKPFSLRVWRQKIAAAVGRAPSGAAGGGSPPAAP